MNRAETIEHLGTMVARSTRRVARYADLPDAPRVFVDFERARLAKLIRRLEEVVMYADDPRFIIQGEDPV